MKKYLSLLLTTILIIGMMSLPAFAADLTGVTLSVGTLVPDFSPGVYNYDIILPSADSAMPQITFTGDGSIEKQAEYPGDSTVINSNGADYTFTVRAPYEFGNNPQFTLVAEAATAVKSSSVNTAWTSSLNHVDVVRTNGSNEKPQYVLIRFNLNGKNVDTLGKFELGLMISNKYSNNVDIDIKAANTPNDWINADSSKGTYAYAFGDGTDMFDESAVVSFDTDSKANFKKFYLDISPIVKNQLAKGNEIFTLALDMDSSCFANNDTVAANEAVQVNFYGIDNLSSDNYKPVIRYFPVSKSSDASLKNVIINDGVLDKAFSPDVTAYKIGVPEGKTPEIKYILSSSHANAVYTPAAQIGDTASVAITAQDGTSEKTYTFELVSMEEAGITADGKLEALKLAFKSEGQNLTELDENAEVKLEASLRNNNINKKSATIVAVIKKDGVLQSVEDVKTEEISSGNKIVYSEEFILPSDITGVSLEAYAFDKETKLPLADKIELPQSVYQPTVSAASEKIQASLNGKNITFFGKAAANTNIPFVLMKPNSDITDFTKDDTSDVEAIAMVKSNAQGIWEYTVEAEYDNNFYTAYISENGMQHELPVLHTTLENKLQVLDDVYDDIYDNAAEAAAVSALKATMGLNDAQNNNENVLGLDTAGISQISEDALLKLVLSIAKAELGADKPSAASEADIQKFNDIYNSAFVITKLNSGIGVVIPEIISKMKFADLNSLYSLVNTDSEIEAALLRKGFNTPESLYNELKTSMLLSVINNPENPTVAQETIETHGGYLALDMAGYGNLENYKDDLISELLNCGPYSTPTLLDGKFDELILKYKEKLGIVNNTPGYNPPVYQGGGGGGTVGTPEAAGSTEEGKLNTEDLLIKPSKVFTDIETDNWAYEATSFLASKKILSGFGDGSFAPDKSVKREEFAKILCLAFNLEEKEEEIEFNDVSASDWYYNYVKTAYQNGAVNGVGDLLFGTGSALKRQDIAVILARVLNIKKTAEEKFADDDSISDYAKEAVYTLKAMGILSGRGDGNFEPMRAVTRAECAKIVYELVKEAE